MRKFLTAVGLVCATLAPVVAHGAEPAAPAAPAATKAQYKVGETDLGTLLDDPAAKAVLNKHVAALISNEQIDMARSMTLTQLQQYAGEALTAETLAKIQADLDAAAPK